MQHAVSFLHSLETATCPYLPDQSTNCLPSHCWKIILVLSSHLCLCLPSILFPLRFPTKTLHAPPPHVCSTQLILLYLITKFLVSSTEHKASHCAVFSTPLLPITLRPIFPAAPYSQTPSAFVSRLLWDSNFRTLQNNSKIIILCILKECI